MSSEREISKDHVIFGKRRKDSLGVIGVFI